MENLLVQEIAERKSVTNWTDKKISPETWAVLLEAARRAPSSWNHQPARYVLVDDEENK
jgi:nitroreductase